MIGHRIKQLREAHGESQRALGEALGRDKSVVSRLEKGAISLDLEMARKVAKHYGVSLTDVLDIESEITGAPQPAGMAEDCAPYTPAANDPLSKLAGTNRYQFKMQSDVLKNIGIAAGDIVVIDDSAAACTVVKPLQAVQVNWHDPADGRSKLLMRQFVPPGLLITNGPINHRSIDMTTEDAHIVGVVVSSHKTFLA